MDYSTHAPVALGRIAGALYIIIAVAAMFAHFYVPDALVVAGDGAATAARIAADPGLFRAGIGAEVFILLIEVILSVILYVLLRPVNGAVAILAMVSRLIMTTVHGINLLNHVVVLILVGAAGSGFASGIDAGLRNTLVSLFIDAHDYGFTIGIIFLTIHVFALGYLIVKSGYFPRVLGYLFVIAGIGYLIDGVAILLVPAYGATPVLIAIPITLAEISFPIWLLIRGVRREEWHTATAAASA